MNKICTSLEQSKKLMELGINVNTSDMCYDWSVIGKEYSTIAQCRKYIDDKLPAWSLTALLDVLEQVKEIKHQRVTILVGRFAGNQWYVEFVKVQDESSVVLEHSKELVDACVEMISKLHDLKLI